MTREELLTRARKQMWAAWTLNGDEMASVAATALMCLGMLVEEGGAAELARLRSERNAAGELVLYRARYDHEINPLGEYGTRASARAHCEAHARRDWPAGTFGWVPEDGSPFAAEELSVFGPAVDDEGVPEETVTGYSVRVVEIGEYDEELDDSLIEGAGE